ncbi:hypothetical protein [Indioceanicola profundi]|uniref:hypothetical protein n=1 Tax=Indioceanicola profundi TaxID=2220096 RepID=UPI000E6AE01A|nr:hypothetical protein [Indioceanicola profundi]
MKRTARLAWTIGLLLSAAATAHAQSAQSADNGLPAEIYEKAVAGITPEMMTECESMAMQAIAAQVRIGAGVEWLSPMAAGETGRLISSSWADRVGRTEESVAALGQSYLIAVTGRANVSPKQSEPFTAIPVCWFDYEAGAEAPALRTATVRK